MNDTISRWTAIDVVNRLSLGETDAVRLSMKISDYLNRLPSTPQPDIIRCCDCKYFELNHFDNVNGIPLITAHEICTRWGDGCKTDSNGFCFLAEQKGEE